MLRDIIKLAIVIGLWAGFLKVILPLAEIGDYKIGYLAVFAIILFFVALTKELVKLPELDKRLETPGGLWVTGIISVVVSVLCGIEFLHKLLFVRPTPYLYLFLIFQSVFLLVDGLRTIKKATSNPKARIHQEKERSSRQPLRGYGPRNWGPNDH